MPDTPPESGAEETGTEETGAQETGTAAGPQPDEATKSLDDVPEWVSEIRRLYVEPKTRARLRQEGAIAPQKRKLGLPGMRGPRRSGDGNAGDRAGGAHSARSHSEPSDLSGQAPTAPSAPIFTSTAAVPPADVAPADPGPAYDGRGVAEPDVSEVEQHPIAEEQVGAWLNSYLVATGHAADDGEAEGLDEPGSSDAPVVDEAPPASSPVQPAPAAAAADPEDRARAVAPQPWSGGEANASADAGADAGSDLEPLEEERHRSLAELAGLSPPEPSPDTWLPAVPPAAAAEPPVDTVVTSIPESGGEPEPRPVSVPVAQPEPLVEPAVVEPAVIEPAAEFDEPDPAPVTVPTTPPPAVVEAVAPEPAPDQRAEPELADAPGARTVEASEAQPAESTAASHVGRSVAAVGETTKVAADEEMTNVAADLETTTPTVAVEESTPVAAAEETTPATVVEGASPDLSEDAPVAPPVDLAAEDGSDHGHRASPGRPSTVPAVTLSWREAESFDIGLPDVEDDEGAILVEPPSQMVAVRRRRREHDDPDAAPSPTESEVEPEPQPEPDPTPSEATGGSSKLRWILIAVIGLLIVAAAAWYFLLRDDGSGAGAPSGAGTVVTASTLAPGADRVARLV